MRENIFFYENLDYLLVGSEDENFDCGEECSFEGGVEFSDIFL